jgi:urea transport system substrate-binding protein
VNKKIVTIIITTLLFFTVGWYVYFQSGFIETFLPKRPIKVGVLHSITGTMAISEKPVVDSTLMAIEEINQQGGILGRKVEPIVVDGHSDWPTFAEEAERLIVEEEVSVVFGCWTSASRKTVKPVFEKHNHLLFYPVQYEGLEQSKNIVYTGAAPNQQIIPAVKWCFDNLGSRFFLVGSDYVFPRTANEIIKDLLNVLEGNIVGEEYILLGSDDVLGVVQKIVETRPDVILNTINGDSNIHFFKKLRDSGITSDRIPTMSFSIAEDELRILGAENMKGDYASWNYFQCLENDENRKYVERFKERYGSHRVTDDPMEAGYFGVKLWAQAVREAGTDDVSEVRKAIKNQSYNAPEGMIYVNSENNHVWKTVRIGEIKADGQFNIVWSSEKPIRPVPYPAYRSKSQWNEFLQSLYKGWGNKWANSG